ncbi:hypothetical protein Fcan01_09596 [Folsomia candida]|uniref:N-acetyltransferase domain-containing protein n=1 Tax=Folsomia candida TaxID=158441 RepID=A0A226EF07_FOLCA|nr:hypothetical protein Fcan01_09596 [Folsomia candida]
MIRYELITRERYIAVADFLVNDFFVNEPFGLALGLTLDQVRRWFADFLSHILDTSDPVSYVALDSNKDDKIVGAIINLIADPEKEGPRSMKTFLDPDKEPIKIQIATFLEDLEDGLDIYAAMGQPSSSKIHACLFLSVADGYGGQGIAKELVANGERAAKAITGVTIAMTDVTSAYSYKVYLKLGYKMIKEVEYMSYQGHDGVYIFKGESILENQHIL